MIIDAGAAGSTSAGSAEAFKAQLMQLREVLVAAQGEVAAIEKERDEVRFEEHFMCIIFF
jgi:uncharacterized protein (DUF3084 family)